MGPLGKYRPLEALRRTASTLMKRGEGGIAPTRKAPFSHAAAESAVSHEQGRKKILGFTRENNSVSQKHKLPLGKSNKKAGLTSTMIVAIKRVGSNMRLSCFSGPMRKMVLRGKHTQGDQSKTDNTRLTESPPWTSCTHGSSNSSWHVKSPAFAGKSCVPDSHLQPTYAYASDHPTSKGQGSAIN